MATKELRKRFPLQPAAVLLVLAACTPSQDADNRAVCNAYRGASSNVEVVAAGTVTQVFGTRPGVSSPHEGFLMRLHAGCDVTIRVEANVDFTGQIPLQTGDVVEVKGEYEYYPRGGVIHWTHRDPRGRHEGGYIEAAGKIYD
jgi:Protein of unknown function (DUF3465)